MHDDTREELERIEKELLAQEELPALDHTAEVDELQDLDAIMKEFSGPAFDDPTEIREPKEPMVYCNYSNDYGKDLQNFADNGGEEPKKETDKVVVGLMVAICGLCLGIIGVLTYWLNVFL